MRVCMGGGYNMLACLTNRKVYNAFHLLNCQRLRKGTEERGRQIELSRKRGRKIEKE